MPYFLQVHGRLSLHHSWKGRREGPVICRFTEPRVHQGSRTEFPKVDPPTIYSRISWWIGENADSLSPCQLSEVKAQESASQGHLHGQKWLLHLAMYSSKCSSSPTYGRWDKFSGLRLVLLKQEREHNKREDNWMYHFVVKVKYCFIELFVLVTYIQIWADQEVRLIFSVSCDQPVGKTLLWKGVKQLSVLILPSHGCHKQPKTCSRSFKNVLQWQTII